MFKLCVYILCFISKDKEEQCRAKFEKSAMFMKMPRNPIRGDLTSREDAEYAIPFHHSIMLKLEEQKYVYEEPPAPTKLLPYIDDRTSTFARSNPQVEDVRRRIQTVKQPHLETLRNRSSAMENELEQMKRLAEYKRSLLAGASGSSTGILTLPSYKAPPL